MEIGTATATMSTKTQATSVVEVKAAGVKKSHTTGDWLVDTTMTVEAMTQNECLTQLSQLSDKSDRSWYTIGGILQRIREQQWWAVRGHTSLESFIEAEMNLPKARAMRWINLYTNMANLKITIEELDSVGWTKLKEASPYLNSNNKEQLLQAARSMSVSEFTIYLKGLSSSNKNRNRNIGGVTNIVNLKLSLHEDQAPVIEAALERAMKLQGTEHKAVALTSICEQYLAGANSSGGGHVSSGAVLVALQEMGEENLSMMLTQAFPHLTIQISQAEAFNPGTLAGEM